MIAGGLGRDDAVHRRGQHRQLELVGAELPGDVDVVGVARAPRGHDRDVVEAVGAAALLAASDLYFHRSHPRSRQRTRRPRARRGRRRARPKRRASAFRRVRQPSRAEHSNGALCAEGPWLCSNPTMSERLDRPSYDPHAIEAAPPGGLGASATPSATPAAVGGRSRTSTSSPRRRSPRATSTSATSAATRSATPTRASAAPAATTCCSRSASTPSACPPSWARSPAASPPSEWVARCAEHMTGQLERLGFSFDWERSFMSSDAVMYRWSQWLFLTLLEAGLIYRGTGTVDWCDNCQTTLASIQVEAGGTCWRCHNPVRLIELPQWYLRISAYVEENDSAPGRARGERHLGRGGARLPAVRAGPRRRRRARADAAPTGEPLTVFTPHADALGQARFVLISPAPPEVERVGRRTPDVRRAAGAAALRRLGAQRARGGDDPADRHRAHAARPRAASRCR